MKILPSLLLLLCTGSALAQDPLPRLELGVGLLALDVLRDADGVTVEFIEKAA